LAKRPKCWVSLTAIGLYDDQLQYAKSLRLTQIAQFYHGRGKTQKQGREGEGYGKERMRELTLSPPPKKKNF